MVAVAGLLWISWCVLRGADFFVFVFVFDFRFPSNAHGLLHVAGRLASFTSLIVPGCVQGAIIMYHEAKKPLHNEAVFCLQGTKPPHTGVRTGCHYLISLSVCVRVRVCV